MITLKSCPNCGSCNIGKFRVIKGSHLIHEIMPAVLVDSIIIIHYSVCRDCNLIFQNPRLSDTELNKYYSSGYYRKTVPQPPEGMDKGEKNRAIIDAGIIKKSIGKIQSHLDIGCGRGYLLKTIDAEEKAGVETDVKYIKFKGIEVYREMNKIPKNKKFDLVTSIHALEHVPHPLDYLKSMTEFIKKSGHLVIEVPSWKIRGGPLGFAHLFHFEPDVLKLMCKKAGLEVIQTEFTPNLVLICKAGR